ncbi:MAG TPA: LysR family transcriptional regulator, partial [Pantoea sp.]|nr:LysR family transcriptional regulator [Pantoea sp.]
AIRIGELRDSTMRARMLGSSRVRLLASPAYLQKYGEPQSVEALAQHQLIGFSQLEMHNVWPVWQREGELLRIQPTIAASSGEIIRQLALAGQGIARISDFVSHQDLAAGRLQEVLVQQTHDVRLPVHAVYYRNAELASRITCFLDFLHQEIASQALF